MSAPVGRLNAAIEKLETLKAESTPGPWHHWPEAGAVEIYSSWRDPEDRPSSETVIVSSVRPRLGWGHDIYEPDEPNAELIVVLHRTVDAQLAILRAAQLEHTDAMTPIEKPYWDAALALADAILGSDS